MPTARGRVTLSGRTLIETAGDARREAQIADRGALVAALAERFGLRAPDTLRG